VPTGGQSRGSTHPGEAAERFVAGRLAATGWTILGRRVRAGRAELDLVAVDPGPPACLVVVEVRSRSRRDFGLPEETLDWRKRGHLRAGLGRLMAAGTLPGGGRLPDLPPRIDLVVVEPPRTAGRGAGILRVRHHRGVV
jgi:Holliday junction resolvase-like predicted endonuclease